ncbi:DNA cytosine methyltransferase [Pseudoflavonifractor sp. 524-17]|uniref:DNA cytosine methyltransferase n=1 Tax=Pseudoflavonifractor sp. 524-17 TaxID=2304577 RepID=UPI00137A1EA0|nr:DNA cytosine methyltransferase [Pseudoflavonifractor sp. 524-17]NCE63704.1 DNA cytosine methyltransferase [Pseudoflavonifractor sp. 524-17]
MRILVACEESQAVTKELRRLGHEAYSCDIEPCSGGHPEWHLQVDALELLKMKWDMILAFPPCTYLSNAGAKHLFRGGQLNQERYQKGLEAKAFFLRFLSADCPKIAVENPVSSRIYEMPPHTQEIQPWLFGHPMQKKTRLWLKGLPPLMPTDIVQYNCGCHEAGTWFMKGGKDRQKNRAKTFPGVARAMAQQWAGECTETEDWRKRWNG